MADIHVSMSLHVFKQIKLTLAILVEGRSVTFYAKLFCNLMSGFRKEDLLVSWVRCGT